MRGGAARSLCGHRAGERLAEAFWSGGGGREEAADRPGERGGRSASQRQALFTTSRRSPRARGSRRAALRRSHPSSTRPASPWDRHKTEPPGTSASGSSTFAAGRPTAGEKPQLPLHHGRVSKALYLYRRGPACLMPNRNTVPDRVLSMYHWAPWAPESCRQCGLLGSFCDA